MWNDPAVIRGAVMYYIVTIISLALHELGHERMLVRPLDDVGLAIHQAVPGNLPPTGGPGAERSQVLTARRRKAARGGQAERAVFAVIEQQAAGRRRECVEQRPDDAIGKHVDRYATYHLFRIRRSETGWKLSVAVRTFSLDRGRFVADDGRRLRQALAA